MAATHLGEALDKGLRSRDGSVHVWGIRVYMAVEAMRTDGPLMKGEHSESEAGQVWKAEVLEGRVRRISHRREQEVLSSAMFDKHH